MTRNTVSPAGSDRRITIALYAGLLIIVLAAPLFIKSRYLIHIFNLTLINIIAAASLRFIAVSGQLSLAHAAFMSIGAYTAGILAKHLGLGPWITIPAGALVTMGVAILIGYPLARLRAIYFSMVSLFFGIGILAVNQVLEKYTGGYSGLIGIPPLFSGSKVANYYFFTGLTVFSLVVLHRLEFCRIGMTLKSIAQSHMVASSVGINESGYRIFALAIGCLFVGVAGAGFAYYSAVLSHSAFNFLASVNFLVYVLVGGIGHFAGPIVGTAVLIIIPELFRALKGFVPFIFAGIMILVIFVMPLGLVGLPSQIASSVKKIRERKAFPDAP
ncbi:MAG: branched-chain amino acid ABC transporter permease [Deltaproteobacteria bacterium]|nr:branched-chain amino acid ABC transporter permease [Deltaproteobacteria bacterium]